MIRQLTSRLVKISFPFFVALKNLLLFIIICICFLITPVFWFASTLNINSLLTFLVLLFLIQVVHIFFYFSTIYQYSKYTSVVKFFWLRVFTIFWGLEFYLFGIVTFLYFIAPAELTFFWELSQVKLDRRWPNITTSYTYLVTLLTIFNINNLGYYTLYRNKFLGYGLIVIVTTTLLFILLKELEVYYYYALVSHYKKNSLMVKPVLNSVVSLSNELIPNIREEDVLKARETSKYMSIEAFSKQFNDEVDHHKSRLFLLNVILSIKFWHVYVVVVINFIYLYLVISRPKQNALEVLGLWQQNLIILLLFWALNYTIYFKLYYKKIAYGFYSNITFYDLLTDYSMFLEELHLF